MESVFRPIGVIHSPFHDPAATPVQPIWSQAIGVVEVYDEYAAGLSDIDEMTHVILLYVFHRSSGHSLHVVPFLDDQPRGIFATRHPRRPNPIGLSIVRLLSVKGNTMTVEGIDVLDETPLLDIKPYVPDFDIRRPGSAGWYDRRSTEE